MTAPPPSTVTEVPIDRSASVWGAVADHLERFAGAWDADPAPPDPAAFLPAGPPEVRRLVLVELVKLDLDQRAQRDLDRPLEDYLGQFPELAVDGPPSDLLYEDYHVRKRAGRPVDAGDYFRRFPGQAAELGRLLGGTVPERSTAVHATKVPVSFKPGDRLDDFDLLALLGEGQFAKVFLARQRAMQRLVALKVSAARGAEAQTLAQLDHPHVVRVYDQRIDPEHGVLLVYMPFLAGGTLHGLLAHARTVPADKRSGRTLLEAVDASLDRRGLLPPSGSAAREGRAGKNWPATVCALGAKLASALDYAHRHGVLHRDVKPANVLLTSEGEPLLADFNVGCCSKLEGAGPAAFFGGSLAYMAAEHLDAFNPDHPRAADSLDGRADLFGLAVTLWELATGSRPFGPENLSPNWKATLANLAEQRRAGPTPAAVAGFPDGVPGLKEVLLRCLEADPDRRPATAGEMARELELCLRPATRALVRSAPNRWRTFATRHPLVAIYPPGLAPNIFASLFNIDYNRTIIESWGGAALHAFPRLVQVVNGVFFPIGMALFAAAMWPVARTLRRLRAGEVVDPAYLGRVRRWALRLGGVTAGVCVGCWLVAGVVWPVVLRVLVGPHPHPAEYLHFAVSLAVCGLIAAAYPYFIITFVAVRVLYPALLGPDGPGPDDAAALRRTERELRVYWGLATAVPLAAIFLVAWRGSLATPPAADKTEQHAVETRRETPDPAAAPAPDAAITQPAGSPLVFLSITGLAGTALAFFLEARTRADLAALAELPGQARS